MAFECLLDVLLLGDDEQVLIHRDVELPFQPAENMLLNGLDERLTFGQEIPSLKVDRVIWDNEQQRFLLDCGTVNCNDEDMEEVLAKWADWHVVRRDQRTIPRWVSCDELEDFNELIDNQSGVNVYYLAQPPIRVTARRELHVVDEPAEGEEQPPATLQFVIEMLDSVLYQDGQFYAEDDDRKAEWVYNTREEVQAALLLYYMSRVKDMSV